MLTPVVPLGAIRAGRQRRPVSVIRVKQFNITPTATQKNSLHYIRA